MTSGRRRQLGKLKRPVHHAMISRKRWSGTYIGTSRRTGFCKSTSKNRLDGYTKCGEAGSGRRDGPHTDALFKDVAYCVSLVAASVSSRSNFWYLMDASASSRSSFWLNKEYLVADSVSMRFCSSICSTLLK